MRASSLIQLLLFGLLGSVTAGAQTGTPAAAAQSCPVEHVAPSAADIAATNQQFEKAETLYKTDWATGGVGAGRAHAGWIRALLSEQRLEEADKAARTWAVESPQDPWGRLTLGMVQLRQGDVPGAAASLQAAFAIAPCNASVRAALGQMYELNSLHASARKMMDAAHNLAPDDLSVEMQWLVFQGVRAADLEQFLQRSNFLTPERRDSLDGLLERSRSHGMAACRLVSPFQAATIPYRAIQNGPRAQVFWGLDVGLDGRQVRMTVGTSSSGVTVSRDVAKSLHLSMQTTAPSSGSQNAAPATALVKQLKIGGLEFANCPVRVVDHVAGSADGIVGAVVFRNFLLTLDYPGRTVKLSALPALHGVASEETLDLSEEPNRLPLDDRNVDASMKDWTQALRLGSQLLVPVSVNQGPRHLFLVATDVVYDSVSKTEPHHTANLVRDNGSGMAQGSAMGRGGDKVNSVRVERSEPLDLYFSNIHLSEKDGVNSIDTSRMGSDLLGVYGILGLQSLETMTLTIDYRDGLVHFEYDPKRVVRCNAGINLPGCS